MRRHVVATYRYREAFQSYVRQTVSGSAFRPCAKPEHPAKVMTTFPLAVLLPPSERAYRHDAMRH